MSVKAEITALLLPALQKLAPGACAEDLLFFGDRADIASPIPQKYGLDMSGAAVYNICDEVKIGEIPLLSSVEIAGGFINLTISPKALGELIAVYSAMETGGRDSVIEHGPNMGSVYARLLDIAHQAGEAQFPQSGLSRRALWLCLTADSPSSLRLALELTHRAISEHRRRAVFGRREAAAMAAALWAAQNSIESEC